jgi:predicted component of type VI protein secretion system
MAPEITLLQTISEMTSLPFHPAVSNPSQDKAGDDVMQALDRVFDLTREDRNIIESYNEMTVEEQTRFLSMVAKLLQRGFVGTETYDIGGRPLSTLVESRIAEPGLRNLPPHRKLDLRA